MIAYILCEGASDVELLRQVLPKDLLNEVEIIAAGGLSAIKSLSRSLLVRRQVPVVIVADADSTNSELIQERIRGIEEMVKNVAVDTPVKVVLAVPAIEAMFFQNKELLERWLGVEPSQELMDLAASQPYNALSALMAQSSKSQEKSSFFEQLAPSELEALRKADMIQEIVQFIQFVQQPAKAS